MKNPQRPGNASDPQQPKLSSQPRQYIDVNDLRLMLKLALGLHTVGDPIKRLTRAFDGLARTAKADAWVAMVLDAKTRRPSEITRPLCGGTDPQIARATAERIEADCSLPGSAIRRLLTAPKQVPGRVLAVIEHGKSADTVESIQTILRTEANGRPMGSFTWVSLHRAAGGEAFLERERRLAALFHSHSAWLLLETVD